MNLDLRRAIIIELHDMDTLLKGLSYIPPEELSKMIHKYSSNREYYCDRFIIKARLLLSKCKGDLDTYNSVHSRILACAITNNYIELRNPIINLHNIVLQSRLPEDNLHLSYALPTAQPKNVQTNPTNHIVTGIGTLKKGVLSLISHKNFLPILLFVLGSSLTFLISYIQYHNETVAFLNNWLPFLHLR